MSLLLFLALSLNLFGFSAHARNTIGFGQQTLSLQAPSADQVLTNAIQSQRRIDYVQVQSLHVSQLLNDDNSGSPHQKFVVTLTSGLQVMIISNLDMCPHVPVVIGDVVNVGGQFIPTGKKSGILHWTHKDPRHTRPDGYIELKGQVYCK